MISRKQLGKKIRVLRAEYEFSQAVVAKKLGIARPSISQIEAGTRALNQEELARLASLFDLNIYDLLGRIPVSIAKPTDNKMELAPVRPKFNKEKFKETILYILERCGAKTNVGETVLYKLLYFADFDFFEIYGQFLTGAQYRKIDHGPAPRDFNAVMEEMMQSQEVKRDIIEYFGKTQKRYLPLRNADLSIFRAHETKLIDNVIERLSDMNAAQISEYSHYDMPWQATADRELIDYGYVFLRAAPYARRNHEIDFMQTAVGDAHASLPPISKEEYDYYADLWDREKYG